MGIGRYPASTGMINWLQGLSGFLTNSKSEYGSVAAMMEHSDWDDGRTEIAIRLIGGILKNLEDVEKEMKDHVATKFG